MGKGKTFIFLLLLGTLGFTRANALPFADAVVSFAGGNGFGVLDSSGGAYVGPVGAGRFHASAATALDGASLGLGGNSGTPGTIVLAFTTGTVVDLDGPDLLVYDTFGLAEGLVVDASGDGATFVGAGAFPGDFSRPCSVAAPCVTEVDLLVTGLEAATHFRLTALPSSSAPSGGCVRNYPECYDLDALEALHFRAAAGVATPGTLALVVLGLGGLRFRPRRLAAPETPS